MRVSIKDLSEKTGYSIATISNVLNGKPGVNSETVRDIINTARSLGYIQQRKIKKVPKTMASLKFLAMQEYEIFNELKNTPLSEFLASDYSFDDKEKIISHEFIEGETGEYYLFNHIPFKREQIVSLEKFYRVYSERKRKDIILDIHPGNFIWSEDKKKWILIDVGAIPEIGSDYYEFEKFEDYFDFVWKKRERMMKEQPIRSMDFGIDLEMR